MLFSKAKMIVETQVRQHRGFQRQHYKLNCDKLRTRIFLTKLSICSGLRLEQNKEGTVCLYTKPTLLKLRA
jgi:hypothetical protein